MGPISGLHCLSFSQEPLILPHVTNLFRFNIVDVKVFVSYQFFGACLQELHGKSNFSMSLWSQSTKLYGISSLRLNLTDLTSGAIFPFASTFLLHIPKNCKLILIHWQVSFDKVVKQFVNRTRPRKEATCSFWNEQTSLISIKILPRKGCHE